MKRLFFFLLAALVFAPVFAQQAEFEKAVSKNKKNAAGNYVADFSKHFLSKEELSIYAKNNGYEIVKFNQGKIKSFGMVQDGIVSVEFAKIAVLDSYADCQSFISKVMTSQKPDAFGRYHATISTMDYNHFLNKWFVQSNTYYLIESEKYGEYKTRFSFVASRREYETYKVHDDINTIIKNYHPLNVGLDFKNILDYFKSHPQSADLLSDKDAGAVVDYIVEHDNFSMNADALNILPKKVILSDKFKRYLFAKSLSGKYNYTELDFYKRFHEYPGWDHEKVVSEDNAAFAAIENENSIRHYLGFFPEGLHASEVSGWYSSGTFSGWKQYRIDYIRKQAKSAESYLKRIAGATGQDRYGPYSQFKDPIKTSRGAECPADLRKAMVFIDDITKEGADGDYQKLFSQYKDYILVINGYWAAKQTMVASESSLAKEDLFQRAINPSAPCIPSNYARSIRNCYTAVNNLMKNTTVISKDVDYVICCDLAEAEKVFVQKADKALADANKKAARTQSISSSGSSSSKANKNSTTESHETKAMPNAKAILEMVTDRDNEWRTSGLLYQIQTKWVWFSDGTEVRILYDKGNSNYPYSYDWGALSSVFADSYKTFDDAVVAAYLRYVYDYRMDNGK